MRRRIFTFASMLSVLLCVATVVLWIRSYWVWDDIPVQNNNDVRIELVGGHISISWNPLMMFPIAASHNPASDYGPLQKPAFNWSFAGFGYWSDPVWGSRGIFVPFRFPVVAFFMLPVGWLIARTRRARMPHFQHCPTCRYNLTGNESGICPECGTSVKATHT
jgi:hypothetical protein